MPDETVQDWRQANDEMGRLRGHIGHINAETDLGEWPEGKAILADFERSLLYT